jgi:hypothetical protein
MVLISAIVIKMHQKLYGGSKTKNGKRQAFPHRHAEAPVVEPGSAAVQLSAAAEGNNHQEEPRSPGDVGVSGPSCSKTETSGSI